MHVRAWATWICLNVEGILEDKRNRNPARNEA